MFAHICFLLCVLLLGILPLSSSQTLSNLPQCWQTCITNASNFDCPALDIRCMFAPKGPASYITLVIVTEKATGVCRAWNGGVLTSVLTCIKSTCDSSLSTDR